MESWSERFVLSAVILNCNLTILKVIILLIKLGGLTFKGGGPGGGGLSFSAKASPKIPPMDGAFW